jgi:hypothetical protein
MINEGYTFTNNTSRSDTYPIYCTVTGCQELVGEITLLAHTSIRVPEATCKAPRIAARYTQNKESEHG